MHSVFKDGKYGPYFECEASCGWKRNMKAEIKRPPRTKSAGGRLAMPGLRGRDTPAERPIWIVLRLCAIPKVQRYCENSTGETSKENTVTRSVLTLAHAQLKGLDCRRSRSRPVTGHPLEINCHHAIPKSQPKLDVRFVGILQGEN